MVPMEIVASETLDRLRNDLSSLGFIENASFGKMLSGSIAAERIGELAMLDSVNFARPIHQPVMNIGSVNNEADPAMRSNLAKTNFGLDGSGIKFGVLSDSWNKLSTAASGIASGDLPGPGNPNGFTTPVQILRESQTSTPSVSVPNTDEGRSMLELIHDITPAAELAFHTANGGPVVFAQGIIALANAGSDVIVDDVTYFNQPFFQDGIIAQAASSVVNRGIPFFSSAGNQANESYESFSDTMEPLEPSVAKVLI